MAWSLSACGLNDQQQMYPTPTYQEYLPGHGEPCPGSQCRDGLSCRLDVCAWLTCSQAPDPGAYCEESIGILGAQCISSACVAPSSSVFNTPCSAGPEACGEQGVCVQGRCRQSCDGGGRVCQGGLTCTQEGTQRFCAGVLRCDERADPDAWCERELGVPKYQGACVFGACTQRKQYAGDPCDSPDDCDSELTCYQGACRVACQSDTQCDPTDVCIKPDDVCLPDTSPKCDDAEIPAVSCAITEGYSLERAYCTGLSECVELPAVEWPVLLIKDVSADPEACVRRTRGWNVPGATPMSLRLTPLTDMESARGYVNMLREEIVQEGISFSQNSDYFEFQGNNTPTTYSDTLCVSASLRAQHFSMHPPSLLDAAARSIYASWTAGFPSPRRSPWAATPTP